MTPTPFNDIMARAKAAAVKGVKLHLDNGHAVAIATDPEIQSLLAAKSAREIERCLAASEKTEDDSPGLPLFLPAREQLRPPPVAQPPRASAESVPRATSSGSNGEPSGGSISSLGTNAPLVQDAASQQALDQVQETIRLGKLTKRLQRGTLCAVAPQPRRHRRRQGSAPS